MLNQAVSLRRLFGLSQAANSAQRSMLRTPSSRLPRRQAGQGMTEYIVIVALIGVAAIGVYASLGQTIRNQTAGIAAEISGNSGANAQSSAGTSANTAGSRANATKGLSQYHSNNDAASSR